MGTVLSTVISLVAPSRAIAHEASTQTDDDEAVGYDTPDEAADEAAEYATPDEAAVPPPGQGWDVVD